MELFWQTIARYNLATWPAQLVIVTAGIVLTVLLYRRPGRAVRRTMKCYLILLNLWIAGTYYLLFCGQRAYSGVMALFWGVMAAVWVYDMVVDYTTFDRTHRHDKFAFALYLIPFVYPVYSLARGMSFPMLTSPVMPCTVAIYTIGLLLSFSGKVNLFIVLFLCHWALVGFSKIYFFGIPEDILLVFSLFPALYLFFKEYVDRHLRTDSKPGLRTMHLLLMMMCGVLGVFFTLTVWQQIAGLG